jgi:hypothetical protein
LLLSGGKASLSAGDSLRRKESSDDDVCRTGRWLHDDEGPRDETVTGSLAAYLALLHTAGPEALQHEFTPAVGADVFTVWGAVGPDLRPVLRHEGERVVCPQLGTAYPVAA